MSVLENAPFAGGDRLKLEQRASLPGFLGLSLKNGLLNIVTLTLYRFWGKTEVRRRIWSSTYLNDEPLEYTGRGLELFLGFLIALLVVGLPFLLAIFGAQMLGPVAAALIILPLELFLLFLVGFGMFTAFRYMASRTAWRGIRFELAGSAADYGLRILAYTFVSGLTLGWFVPVMRRKMAKHVWRNLRFGDMAFGFDEDAATKVKVYGAFALAWVGTAVIYVLVAAFAIGASSQFQGAANPGEMPLEAVIILYGLILLFMPLLILLYAPFQAAVLRSIVAGVTLGEARFRLTLGWAAMAGLTITNLLMVIFSLGFLMPFVQARTTKFLINRITPVGSVDLSAIRQTEPGPRTGEGLADAFGLAPI